MTPTNILLWSYFGVSLKGFIEGCDERRESVQLVFYLLKGASSRCGKMLKKILLSICKSGGSGGNAMHKPCSAMQEPLMNFLRIGQESAITVRSL